MSAAGAECLYDTMHGHVTQSIDTSIQGNARHVYVGRWENNASVVVYLYNI